MNHREIFFKYGEAKHVKRSYTHHGEWSGNGIPQAKNISLALTYNFYIVTTSSEIPGCKFLTDLKREVSHFPIPGIMTAVSCSFHILPVE
jgi:hypothetical protein